MKWIGEVPTKVCSTTKGSGLYCCGEEKPITEFGLRTRRRKNGNIHTARNGRCKACETKRERKNKAENKVKRVEGEVPPKVWAKFLNCGVVT